MLDVLFELSERLPSPALATSVLLWHSHCLGDFSPGVEEDLVQLEEALVIKDPATVRALDCGGASRSTAPTGLLIWKVLIMM